MSDQAMAKAAALRSLPSVDQLLRTEPALKLRDRIGATRITALARSVTEEIRAQIQAGRVADSISREDLLLQSVRLLEEAGKRESQLGIRRVINATGVILHTNLGRAPLSQAARVAISQEAAGYCTLEYDPLSGLRGRRGARVEMLLSEITGAEDALVVNNCAAAAFLVLSVLAKDRETIVSRGELVEIGGDFRVPDVMANSGTHMVEVGTTNRTRLDDYRRAITERTRVIMRVHQSNYRIIGFTSSPTVTELAALAHESNLLLFEDAGSGVLIDLSRHGLGDEPIVQFSIRDGADIVSFSGDKLLGGIQAGLIVGRRDIVGRLRKHSLYRALRVDKLTLAALAATLESFVRGASLQEVPALRMLAFSKTEITERAQALQESLSTLLQESPLKIGLIEGTSAIGGGSGPNTHPVTTLIALHHETLSVDELQRHLRLSTPPVITRIADRKVLIDLRTVAAEEEADLMAAIANLANLAGTK